MAPATNQGAMKMYADNGKPLTEDQLLRKAPAIFAESPHASRSDRYAFVPTLPVIRALETVGFLPYDASAARVREESRAGFQKHLVRMRHVSNVEGAKGGVAELVLISAHDGSCSYRMLAGWFEFLCTNGFVVGSKEAELRVRHKGSQEEVLREVRDSGAYMVEYLTRLGEKRAAWSEVTMDTEAQYNFAKKALETRYKGDNKALEPWQILAPRRVEEQGIYDSVPRGDLWATLNVVQENLIRGGLVGKDKRGRARRQRSVKAIEQNTRVNRELWGLAEKVAA